MAKTPCPVCGQCDMNEILAFSTCTANRTEDKPNG